MTFTLPQLNELLFGLGWLALLAALGTWVVRSFRRTLKSMRAARRRKWQ